MDNYLEKDDNLLYTYINYERGRSLFMKSSRIMKIFEQYVRKYDMNNINIRAKYFHSLKVMEIVKELANALNIFTEEEIAVCELIGLFHEIGSFSKTPDFHIGEDNEDSYDKTIEVLFNKGLLREISKDKSYDNIIRMALFAYDKDGFPSDIDEKAKHICAILKDAHNLDYFRFFVNYPYIDTRIKSYPSSLVYNDFKNFKTISSRMSDNSSDSVLIVLSKMYAFNYKYSYYLLRKNDYIDKIIDSLTFDDKEIQHFFEQIVLVLKNYIDKRIGVNNAR